MAEDLNINPVKPRVLIVDDEEHIRTLISEMLDGYYTPIEACDGSEAVKIALTQNPDVIIMDLFMPVMDGCTASIKIKQQSSNPVPIIAMTGKGGELQESLMLSMGATKYLSKPFNQKELLSVISSVIQE